jgi:acetyl esterase/lipase
MSPPTDFLVDWYDDPGFPRHEDGMSPIVDLLGGYDLDDPTIRERARLASPVALATSESPPMLVVHGMRDDIVPVGQGRKLVTTLLDLGGEASLLELPMDDHGLASVFGDMGAAPPVAMGDVIAFFVQTLGSVARL